MDDVISCQIPAGTCLRRSLAQPRSEVGTLPSLSLSVKQKHRDLLIIDQIRILFLINLTCTE